MQDYWNKTKDGPFASFSVFAWEVTTPGYHWICRRFVCLHWTKATSVYLSTGKWKHQSPSRCGWSLIWPWMPMYRVSLAHGTAPQTACYYTRCVIKSGNKENTFWRPLYFTLRFGFFKLPAKACDWLQSLARIQTGFTVKWRVVLLCSSQWERKLVAFKWWRQRTSQ